jgi:hypothetical protein
MVLFENLFSDLITINIKGFFLDNWIVIIIILGMLIALFFIYKNTIRQLLIKGKIKKLEKRKNIVKELVIKTQKDYFDKGSISEGNYNIRIKKLTELIRDIDKQIPLLKEKLINVEIGSINNDSESETSYKKPVKLKTIKKNKKGRLR